MIFMPYKYAWLAQSVERLTLNKDIKRLRVRPPHWALFLFLHLCSAVDDVVNNTLLNNSLRFATS